MKTKTIFPVLFWLITAMLHAQVGIGGDPDASAQLDVQSSDKGILIPRVPLDSLTQTQLDGTNTAAEGLLIYNTNESLPDGKGFYFFNGSEWEKVMTRPKTIYVVPISFETITRYNTSGEDVPGYDTALEPIFFNPSGKLEVKLIVRYSEVQGTVHFQLRAHDLDSQEWPIVFTDFGIYATTQNGGVATSDWKKWDAGINAYELHLFSWMDDNGNSEDHVKIESAYVLVRSQ